MENNNIPKKRVLLGMSGGVDSTASALLLMQKGYEVIGCTMVLFEDRYKANSADEEAKKICEQLGIEHHTFHFENEFKCSVIQKFAQEYQNAKTPNPCVECNQYLKFGVFYDKAKELNCDFFATGHYAKIEYSEKYKQYVLRKSSEDKKDQTYFLYRISKEKLEHIIFPLQEFTSKEEIRNLVKEAGIEIFQKKDSQEICFIEDNDYQKFLVEKLKIKPKKGKFVLTTGEVLGEHKGLIYYTIGQRKGLGISYKEPLYVVKLDLEKNEVILGTNQELFSKSLMAENINWVVFNQTPEKLECFAKIRYRAKEAKAIVYKEGEKVKVKFEEPQRAITKGQSVVFYDEDGILLGGGVIC